MNGAYAAVEVGTCRAVKRDPRSVRRPGCLACTDGATVLSGAVRVHDPEVIGFVAVDDLRAVGGPLRPVVLSWSVSQLANPRPVRVHRVDVEQAAPQDGEGDP